MSRVYSGAKWEMVGEDGANRRLQVMFRGATKVTLDAKGRMVIPTRYRDELLQRAQGKLIITIDRDQCLLLYPLPDWEPLERKLMSLPSMHPQSRKLQRLMVGHATDMELDGHGRVSVPQELREFAALDTRGMFIGQGNHFELWDETRWAGRRDLWLASEETPTDLPSELDSLTL